MGVDEKLKEKKKNKVLIAIDESDCSGYALAWAVKNLSNKLKTNGLILFTAISVDFGGVYASTIDSTPVDLVAAIQENQSKFVVSLLEKAKELCAKHGVDSEIVSAIGKPKDAICDAVEKFQCGLLIVGSHGRGAVQRAFLGSVSNYCVHNAKCPVLVVRRPA